MWHFSPSLIQETRKVITKKEKEKEKSEREVNKVGTDSASDEEAGMRTLKNGRRRVVIESRNAYHFGVLLPWLQVFFYLHHFLLLRKPFASRNIKIASFHLLFFN